MHNKFKHLKYHTCMYVEYIEFVRCQWYSFSYFMRECITKRPLHLPPPTPNPILDSFIRFYEIFEILLV